MPPRLATVAIVLFWLGTTAWLGYRDVWPRLRPGEPPPFTIDLTDEVSARSVNWSILDDGKGVGFAKTEVERRPDRTFELKVSFTFQKPLKLGLAEIKKLMNAYRVNSAGELLGLQMTVSGKALAFEGDVKLEGQVEDDHFTPRVFLNGIDLNNEVLKLEAVRVTRRGGVVNPMHPLNRISGLKEGQEWRIQVTDPAQLVLASAQGALKLPVTDSGLKQLDAEVTADTLRWHNADVPCWRVDYRQHREPVTARTWVRRTDGIVLRQEATQLGRTLALVRDSRH
jgi:hypothetical protein